MRRGQALVMVAFALVAICGFLALAVDVGLAYSVRKSAQAASDAGALAGAANALASGVYSPISLAACGASASTPHTAADSACLYAAQNGFSNGGNGGSQTVSVASDINPSPYAPGVNAANYWVMVVVTQQMPLFFGGVLNSPFLTVRTSSVAAIVHVAGSGSSSAGVALVQ